MSIVAPPESVEATTIWNKGMIVHAATWNVALSEVEIKQLSSGVPVMSIRRDNLQSYYPMTGVAAADHTQGGWHHAYGVFG